MNGCRQWQQGHAGCVLPAELMLPAMPCIVVSYSPRTVQVEVLLLTPCLAASVHSCSMALKRVCSWALCCSLLAGNPAPAQRSHIGTNFVYCRKRFIREDTE